MPPVPVAASFWRGGTSRGLLVRAETLAPIPASVRERIIKTALGSPDPAGRQIDGLGGGVSSLSKVAIIGAPGEGTRDQQEYGALPGVAWADQGHRNGKPYDLVYRFGQVPVRADDPIDWSASCGNMVAAAAVSALSSAIVPYTTLFLRSRSLRAPSERDFDTPIMFPLSILSASNGVVMNARVPIHPVSLQVWEPPAGQGCEIAGVPGRDEPGIEVEMPLEVADGAGLVTGRVKDEVRLDDGTKVTVSIVSAGLPNVFVPASSLSSIPHLSHLPDDVLTLPTSTLASIPGLASTLSSIRIRAAEQHSLALSLASPKVTLVGPVPPGRGGYSTSSGTVVTRDEADLVVRAVSSGDWHATIPGTTLGAINIAFGIEGTVVRDIVVDDDDDHGDERERQRRSDSKRERFVKVRAGHLAGVAESTVRFSTSELESDGGTRRAEAVVMQRTAREIMNGNVLIPERVFR